MENQTVRLALIGAGNRGSGIFGAYALDQPQRAKFVAVVEPEAERRRAFSETHDIPEANQFASPEEFFAHPPAGIDGVVIATLENLRFDLVRQSMEKNWHILVEKPLCTNPEDLIRIYDATREYAQILIVCHQMRLTPIYRTIKRLVDSGEYGEIVGIQHSENLAWHHMAHSYVRGLFGNDRLTPMLLAKSCHDLDLLVHLVGRRAVKVSSMGALKHFRKENCPPGAPQFCLEGCPHSDTCAYDAAKLYFDEETDPACIRQMGVVRDKAHLRELLLKNQFGRCVYQCDNNVVDNQVVNLELEGGIFVSFTMCGHNAIERRMTKISLTNGEIEYQGRAPEVLARRFEPRVDEVITVHAKGTHGGGDRAIMDNFTEAIQSGDHSRLLTPIQDSLEGHLLVFAAELSRRDGVMIDTREYEDRLRQKVAGIPT